MSEKGNKKQSIAMHPVISIGVVALFLWLGFTHLMLYLEGADYKHLIFVFIAITVIMNRILWLPVCSKILDDNELIEKVRAMLPLCALLGVGVYLIL